MAGTPEISQQPSGLDFENQFIAGEYTPLSQRLLKECPERPELEWQHAHEVISPEWMSERAEERIRSVYKQLYEMYLAGDPDVYGSLSEIYFRDHPEAAEQDNARTIRQGIPEELLLITKDRAQKESGHTVYVSVAVSNSHYGKSLHISRKGGNGPHISDEVHIYSYFSEREPEIRASRHFRNHTYEPDLNTYDAEDLAEHIIKNTVIPLPKA